MWRYRSGCSGETAEAKKEDVSKKIEAVKRALALKQKDSQGT